MPSLTRISGASSPHASVTTNEPPREVKFFRFNTLCDFLRESFQQCQDRISDISSAIGGSITQGEQLLRRTALIVSTNVRIFQTVRSIQVTLSHIPQGIERQQLVYMIDALGKTSPFHLEFVRSAGPTDRNAHDFRLDDMQCLACGIRCLRI